MTVNKVSTFGRFLVFLYYNENISKSFIMKKFVILEKYVGYADVTIEAETEQEAIDLYNEGSYDDDATEYDDVFYDFELVEIKEQTDENN